MEQGPSATYSNTTALAKRSRLRNNSSQSNSKSDSQTVLPCTAPCTYTRTRPSSLRLRSTRRDRSRASGMDRGVELLVCRAMCASGWTSFVLAGCKDAIWLCRIVAFTIPLNPRVVQTPGCACMPGSVRIWIQVHNYRFTTIKTQRSLTHSDTSLGCGRVAGHSDSWRPLSRQIFPVAIVFAVIWACELSNHVAMLGADPGQAAIAPTPHTCVAPNPLAAIGHLPSMSGLKLMHVQLAAGGPACC